ncbi:hypothetical protein N0V84_011613 [Fusarium piperis]|uniref:Heterokaryon incompatibility domain-containing protein n=1 Tax=Fusarium piperis TaxID=1435070 RepID=A0A9W8TD84_9HYPO|nr:hypothetical protein N0V84_011613 [Fusarium piperis]
MASSSSQGPEPGHAVYKRLLEWLIPVAYDHQQAEFAQRRHPGTLQWFLNSDTYQKWIHATSGLDLDGQTKDFRKLFCPGPAGAGKTILTSAVIQDLDCRFPRGSNPNVGIAYLYCVYNYREQQSTTNLLLVLLEQLLANRPCCQFPTRLPHYAHEKFSPIIPSPPSPVEVMESLEKVVAQYDRVFFVIDALDECAPDDRAGFLDEIFRLQTKSKVHIFATSDPDSNVERMFINTPSLEIQADQEDVRSYLETSMDQLGAFVQEDPGLREEIKDTIIKAAPGSFLAAVLQLKSLATMSSIEDLRTALVSVAKDSASAHFDALYEDTMRRIESQASDQAGLAKKALSYMTCARCPWTAAELCHALTVKVGEAKMDWDAMPSLQTIIAACSGMMVTVGSEEPDKHDEVSDMGNFHGLNEENYSDEVAMIRQIWPTTMRLDRIAVQLVHRTAHEYLQRTCERWFPERDKQMATTCMAYLSLRYFRGGPHYLKIDLERQLRVFPLYFYAALNWRFHTQTALDKFPDLASIEFEFLGSSSLIEASCDVMFRVGQWPRDGDYLGVYPGGMNGLHIAAYFGIVDLVRALGTRGNAMVNAADGWGYTALEWAAKNGHEGTVEAILQFGAIDVNARDIEGRTPISLAAGHNHTAAITKILLDHVANPNLKDFGQATPIWHAARGGNTDTVVLLTGCGVDLNVASISRQRNLHTPLSLAATNGQVEMVSLLLAQKNIQPRAKIKPSNVRSYTPCTALGLAVHGGHSKVVEVLLSNLDIAAAARTGEDGEMLLHSAIEQGHEETARLLLRNGLDVNAQCENGDTPLHLAVGRLLGAHHGITRLLLSQANLLPNVVNKYGHTPASLAISRGRTETLRLLLAEGVDTRATTKGGHTLLGVAAELGYLPMVELLLATDGVEADSREGAGRTPLTLALNPSQYYIRWHSKTECDRNHCSVVQCLLNSGHVDINSRDDSGQTPLMHATQGDLPGHLNSFRMILDYEGVDIDATDKQEQTALFRTVVTQKQDEAVLLLEKGADPNLVPFYQGETLFSHAAGHGMAELVQTLVSKHGADAQEPNSDGHTALCKAAEGNKVQVFDVLLGVGGVNIDARCSHGQTPLQHAAEAGGEEVALLLLAKGNTDPDVQDVSGRTPLHYAAEKGLEALVSSLLDAGVANADCTDVQGRTPLSLAAQEGKLQIMEKLLSLKGVMPDARDTTGRTPLSLAVQSKPSDASAIVKRLLCTEGVDPNSEDERGWTPLSWAVQNAEASDQVETLLTEGAGRIDINHEDRKGRTPLILALGRGNEVIVSQLRAAGARENVLDEYPVSLDYDEDGEQHDLDIPRAEADGLAWEKEAETEQDSDLYPNSALSEVDSWYNSFETDSLQRERRRWLGPSWFDDASTDGYSDSNGNNSDWSGTPDLVYNRFVWPSNKPQIELGVQDEVASGNEGEDEEELCPQCKALDLDHVFSRGPPSELRVIANLCKVDSSWKSKACAMCKLLAAVSPPGDHQGCDMCAYSSTATWLSRSRKAARHYLISNWVDTIILGIENKTSHYSAFNMSQSQGGSVKLDTSDILPRGFISRIGSNDRHHVRSLTVHRVQTNQVDFGRVRGWIACCAAHHGKRCNPSTHRPITSFRLIDCKTRDIVDGQPVMNQFVALSYVWGSSAREPATVDHDRVENAERVVEDAILATQALGCRYLWVDRHCITNEDEEIRRRQLQEMNSVYANAQVTFVAAAGKDSTFGLPGVSRTRQQPYARIQGHALVAVPPDPAKIVKDSIWWTRGWTFQEGVLSRRRLIFTEHEVSYECRGMVTRESIELPERIHRIAATRYPIHEDMRIFSFSHRGYGRYDKTFSIWYHISEYTERHLTHDYDILNAMLGIMQVAAERNPPVYHLCGVPIVLDCPNEPDGPTLLEAFVSGLCWLVPSGTRREGFPSWSWTGWKGKAYEPKVSAVSFKSGFAVEVSMVARDDPSEVLSWAEFEAMEPKEKAALPQDYLLEITGTAVKVTIRWTKGYSPYAILYNGHDALKGSIELCKDPSQDAGFQRQLVEERLTAIAIGNDDDDDDPLVLLAVAKVGDYWERIGVIKVESKHVLDVHGEGCRKQAFRIR